MPLSAQIEVIGSIGTDVKVSPIQTGNSKGVAFFDPSKTNSPTAAPVSSTTTSAPTPGPTAVPTIKPASCVSSGDAGGIADSWIVQVNPYIQGTLKLMAGVDILGFEAGIGATVALPSIHVPL